MLFLLLFFGWFFLRTSRNDCQLGFVQKESSVSQRGTFSFSIWRTYSKLGFIQRCNGITTVQFSILYKYKLLYSLFNRSSVKSEFFVFIAPHFIPISFFKHQCSNLSPSSPQCKWNRIFKKKKKSQGVLHYISDI